LSNGLVIENTTFFPSVKKSGIAAPEKFGARCRRSRPARAQSAPAHAQNINLKKSRFKEIIGLLIKILEIVNLSR